MTTDLQCAGETPLGGKNGDAKRIRQEKSNTLCKLHKRILDANVHDEILKPSAFSTETHDLYIAFLNFSPCTINETKRVQSNKIQGFVPYLSNSTSYLLL